MVNLPAFAVEGLVSAPNDLEIDDLFEFIDLSLAVC